MNEDRVLQKLVEHDKRFAGIDQRLAEHDRRFDKLDTEISDFKNRVYTAQDEMITILRRLDEERIFTTRWVERI